MNKSARSVENVPSEARQVFRLSPVHRVPAGLFPPRVEAHEGALRDEVVVDRAQSRRGTSRVPFLDGGKKKLKRGIPYP